MHTEKVIEKSFNDLLALLQIRSSEDLFVFEDGKLLRYQNTLDFKFHLTNFYEAVLSKTSNTRNRKQKGKIIESFEVFIMNLCVLTKRIFKSP